jgi:hypothetical protein
VLIEINKTTGYDVYGPPFIEFIRFFIKIILKSPRERPEFPGLVRIVS